MIGRQSTIKPWALLIGLSACCTPLFSATVLAADASGLWTLQRSVERAITIAPETRMAKANIRAGEGAVESAGDWPNPSVTLRVENNIQQQLLHNGYTVDQLTVSQPIPLWRIALQQQVAQQGVQAAQANAIQTRLDVEARVAQLFLTLQLNHEKLQLAEQRQKITRSLVRSLRRPADAGGIVRYVNPLDRARLQLLNEEAAQDTAAARNSYQESLDLFRNYLSLASDAAVQLPLMSPVSQPAPLGTLQQRLEKQAVLLHQLQHQLHAAKTDVDLQRVRRFDDPVLTFIHEKNVAINNQPFTFNGVMLTVSLPVWDRNTGNIEKAQAEVIRAESRIDIARRELSGQLRQDHMQLQHLKDQARRFKLGVLQPAERFLDATQRNYRVGASNSLALIDAYNTYFNARNRYLELLFRGHQKVIDLNQLLGQSLLSDNTTAAGEAH